MRFKIVVLLMLVLGLFGSAYSQPATASHPFSVHDMLAMDRIGDPHVSPDGEWVVFTLRSTDLEANRGRTDLWLISIDGHGLRQLTSHPASDFSPSWAPDGQSIYFLSTRSGGAQIWRIPVGGGEAQQVTDLALGVGNYLLSPDGKTFAITMEVYPECESLECTEERLQAEKDRKASGRIYDRVFIRHWDTWKDGRRSHLFTMAVDGDKPVDLMPGWDADTPSKPFGGIEEVAFAPDSKSLVFTARVAGREEPWSTNFDLYHVPIDGSADPKNLTEANKAWDTAPSFSPDGKTLAYLAMARPGYESDRFRIMLRSWPDGETRALTENWDRSPGGIVWSNDSKTIYTTASNIGQSSLFAINAQNGSVKTVVEKGYVGALTTAGNRLLFGMDHLKSPVELYTVKPDGKDVRQITDINAEKVARARMGDAEQFTFKGWNDETVYCYVVKPVDFDPNKKYPVAFLIHGGPQGSFGNHFHYRWNPQAYTGAGYAAVMVDFHGSVGYGQAFTDAIGGDWGGKPLEDLQKGLAAALARYDWMDGERVSALGASFGGYMINWIAGNWPDRFRALVNHDGNLDERAAYFATEELWFPEWDHRGNPWDNPENFEKHNPVNYVKNWKTPMLVIHGALDYRVVETQGISTFTALQRRGIPSKFLYFPDENHWVLQPHNSILWHETVIDWLDKWTKNGGTN
ncbi:MAG: S9 family peptidase [Deferribacteres bacterium]|nr:S9 family peptidase [Deferribacteres bacterium]